MISSRELLLLFTIVGSFFVGALSASADPGEVLSETDDLQREDDLYHRRTEALNISGNEIASGNYDGADSRVDTRLTLVGHQKVTVTGAPGETVTLKLGHFVLCGNSTFTLEGTATTTFIIKVKNQFSLIKNAKVVLLGGLQWNDVVFEVRGKGDPVFLRGMASLQGILMADKRKVILKNHSIVHGQVMARVVRLKGASQIDQPPIVSP
jgi:hypothetical protein